jgi:hypothetical protein
MAQEQGYRDVRSHNMSADRKKRRHNAMKQKKNRGKVRKVQNNSDQLCKKEQYLFDPEAQSSPPSAPPSYLARVQYEPAITKYNQLIHRILTIYRFLDSGKTHLIFSFSFNQTRGWNSKFPKQLIQMSMWQRYEAENQGTLFGFKINKY